ncbi:hypothetical protein ACQ86N_28655 [Puia sp. P3]|uniref:hypothetical protein n=1 Tax=Puia sp. P3 TaxID=3423952 RepID=UPI003D66B180
MAKQLFFDTDARTRMKKGIDTLANAVRVTLGPQGRNVILEKSSARRQSQKTALA